ncbi:NVEALA domain-containing protein [Bacteroides sp. 51]|uniref:NVEALA domain-containing protein n=1 Tax=Bacteroides sp. 51 TaxID=2302938 RepID=UPI0013D79AE3|nr:NVEALA domain-containing protein [Bacteroides sp. 51]NDV81661.1 hypothetical protein [Bacteroides sp. 51]
MNKKIKIAIVAVFALVVGCNIFTSQSNKDLSYLTLENIEALATENWTGRIYLAGERGTGGCIHCPESDSNCTC